MNVFSAIFPNADLVCADARNLTPRPSSGLQGRKFMDTIEKIANAVHDTSLHLRRESAAAQEIFGIVHSARDSKRESASQVEIPLSARTNKVSSHELGVATGQFTTEHRRNSSSLTLPILCIPTSSLSPRKTAPALWLSRDVAATAESPRIMSPRTLSQEGTLNQHPSNSCPHGSAAHHVRAHGSFSSSSSGPCGGGGALSPPSRRNTDGHCGGGPLRTAAGQGRSPRARAGALFDAAAARPLLSPRSVGQSAARTEGGGGGGGGAGESAMRRTLRRASTVAMDALKMTGVRCRQGRPRFDRFG